MSIWLHCWIHYFASLKCRFCVKYHDYIVKWCSGIVCNWCLSLDIALILALRVEHVGAWKCRTHHWHNPSEGYLEAYIIPFSNLYRWIWWDSKSKVKKKRRQFSNCDKEPVLFWEWIFVFELPRRKSGLKKFVYRLIVMFLSTEIFSKRRKIYAWLKRNQSCLLLQVSWPCKRGMWAEKVVCGCALMICRKGYQFNTVKKLNINKCVVYTDFSARL